MKIRKKTIKYNIIIIICLAIVSCAKQIMPSGGPQDIDPPVMINATPAIATTNFNSNKITIRFNEYIKLNNINQKLVISPPISEKPKVLLSGKTIKISLKHQLLSPNTTYCFNFNDAIGDNNENNILNSFIYAFSTGDYIDSLNFYGQVVDAFTKKPVENTWVLLHNNLADSAFKQLQPNYITKADKNGNFIIPFVADSEYKIYALVDGNYNCLFDLPTESIAFVDETLSPANTINDSIENIQNLKLLLFKENTESQYVKSYKRIYDNYLQIVFNSTQYEYYNIEVEDEENAIIYAKENPDTVHVWLNNKNLISSDSVKINLTYKDVIYPDSVRNENLKFRKPEKTYNTKFSDIKADFTELPSQNILITVDKPIKSFDSTKLKIELKQDSVYHETDFLLQHDSVNPCRLICYINEIENSEYRLSIDTAFITDICDLYNKTESLNIKSSSAENFGNLRINIEIDSKYNIVQLLQSDKVIVEKCIDTNYVDFKYLVQGKYRIRLIEDFNNNKRWDTGNFDKKIQPEPVHYYQSEYDVKSNWNHEIDWKIGNIIR